MLVNGSGVLSGLALEHRSDSHDGLTVSKASDLDPGRVSALNGYLVRLHPDDIAARREHQNLVVGRLGGHAVLAMGYDDAHRRFLVRNSWGTDWGQAGHFTMPYGYLTDSNLSDDFWTIRRVQ